MKTKTVIICRDWKELENECLKLDCDHLKEMIGSNALSSKGVSSTCGIRCNECGVDLIVRRTFDHIAWKRIMHVLDRRLEEISTPEQRKVITDMRVNDAKRGIIRLNPDFYHPDGRAKLQSEIVSV